MHQMRRRSFLQLLGGAAATTAAGLIVPDPVRRIWAVPAIAPVPTLAHGAEYETEIVIRVPRVHPKIGLRDRRPCAYDDEFDGFSVGSYWVKAAANEAWMCVDAAAGAARWMRVS